MFKVAISVQALEDVALASKITSELISELVREYGATDAQIERIKYIDKLYSTLLNELKNDLG